MAVAATNTYAYDRFARFEKNPLERVIRFGWTSIGSAPLYPIVKGTLTTALDSFSRRGFTRMDAVMTLAPSSLIKGLLLDAVNANLKKRYSLASKTTKGRYKQTTEEELWRVIVYLMLEALSRSSCKFPKHRIPDLQAGLVGESRFEAVSAALAIDDNVVDQFQQQLRTYVRDGFEPGTLVVVDESVLEYSGGDMRVLGTDKLYPGKPHPYGLVMHAAMTKLTRTNICVPIDWECRTTTNKKTPSNALLDMIQRLEVTFNKSFNVIADSGFAAFQTLQNSKHHHSKFTMSFSSANCTGLRDLYEVVSPAVTPNKVYNFKSNDLVAQFSQYEKYTTAIVSNNYKLSEGGEAAEKDDDKWDYEDAVLLLQFDAHKLHKYHKCPPHVTKVNCSC